MAEEKENKPQEEKPQEEAKVKEQKPKEEKAQPEAKPKTEAPIEENKAAGTEKKQKINQYSLKEVEKKIEEVQEKMGGLTSSFAQQLLRRKEQLLAKNKEIMQ